MTEAQIQIAAKLYNARRVLRRLLGAKYASYAPRWMDLVRNYCAMRDLDVIHGVMEMLKDAPDAPDDVTAIWILAAAVELIEPDEETPK